MNNQIELKTYRIKKTAPSLVNWQKGAEEARIDSFPWTEADGFCPETSAYLGYDASSLFIYMETRETDIRAHKNGFCFVHTDSCMEFFISPDPASFPKYLNFEFNPLGAMYLSLGTSRHNRTILPSADYKEYFNVKTGTDSKGWNLEFIIPFLFLREHFPNFDENKTDLVMRGNFYKCGDETAKPHYGSWSPINLESPDFHCPDFFGRFIFEG